MVAPEDAQPVHNGAHSVALFPPLFRGGDDQLSDRHGLGAGAGLFVLLALRDIGNGEVQSQSAVLQGANGHVRSGFLASGFLTMF